MNVRAWIVALLSVAALVCARLPLAFAVECRGAGPSEAFSFEVRVLDPDGQPCDGRRVQIEHQDLASESLEWDQIVMQQVTSDGGRTRFVVPHGRRITQVRVLSSETSPGVEEDCWISALTGRGPGLQVVEVPRGGELFGRVELPDGTPAAGAIVQLWMLPSLRLKSTTPERTTVADERGVFGFAHVGPRVHVRALSDGFGMPSRVFFDVEDRAAVAVGVLELLPARRIFGLVTHAGEPVDGAAVERGGGGNDVDRRVLTGADGEFEFDVYGPRFGSLFASEPDLGQARLADAQVTAGVRCELALGWSAALQVSVLDAADAPIPGAAVRLVRRGWPEREALADESGRAELPLDARPAFLQVTAEEWADAWIEVPGARDGACERTVRLVRPLPLVGRVLNRDGDPEIGLRVALNSADESLMRFGFGLPPAGPERLTDAEGGFAWDGLGPGAYRLTVNDHGDLPTYQDFRVQPGPAVAAGVFAPEAARPVSFSVRVIDASTGQAIPGAVVSLGLRLHSGDRRTAPGDPRAGLWGGSDSPWTAVPVAELRSHGSFRKGWGVLGTDSEGRCSVDRMGSNTYSMSVQAEGYVGAEELQRKCVGGNETWSFELWPERQLTVRVLNADGSAVGGQAGAGPWGEQVFLGALDAQGQAIQVSDRAASSVVGSFGGGAERYLAWLRGQAAETRLGGLPITSVRLYARRPGGLPGPQVELPIGELGPREVVLRLPNTGAKPRIFAARLVDGAPSAERWSSFPGSDGFRTGGRMDGRRPITEATITLLGAAGDPVGEVGLLATRRVPLLSEGLVLFEFTAKSGEIMFGTELDFTQVRIEAPGFETVNLAGLDGSTQLGDLIFVRR